MEAPDLPRDAFRQQGLASTRPRSASQGRTWSLRSAVRQESRQGAVYDRVDVSRLKTFTTTLLLFVLALGSEGVAAGDHDPGGLRRSRDVLARHTGWRGHAVSTAVAFTSELSRAKAERGFRALAALPTAPPLLSEVQFSDLRARRSFDAPSDVVAAASPVRAPPQRRSL